MASLTPPSNQRSWLFGFPGVYIQVWQVHPPPLHGTTGHAPPRHAMPRHTDLMSIVVGQEGKLEEAVQCTLAQRKMVQKWIEEYDNESEVLSWSSFKNLWDMLDKQVQSMKAPPCNDLKDLLGTSWCRYHSTHLGV